MEIEKKYLLNEMPDLSKYPSHEIEQGYLVRRPVLRIRKKDDDFIFTYKARIKDAPESLNVCDEVERPLTKEAYEKLRKKTEGYLIQKTRYLIPIQAKYKSESIHFPEELTVELDIFHGRLEGLIVAEIEFPDEKTAHQFIPPKWLGKDVSADRRYSNGHLSELEAYEKFDK